MKIFKHKQFARFARQQGITNNDLCTAIDRAARGLIDADLGGGVIKQRIARPNEGKSGGFRSIILFQAQGKAFFVHGFAKSQKDNISEANLKAYKQVAKVMLAYEPQQLQNLAQLEDWIEVKWDEKNL